MTNFIDKFKNRIIEIQKSAAETVDNYVASSDLQKERLNVCKTCEHFFPPTFSGRKCGCFLKAKTLLKDQTCPVFKW
jgi:hypothetical protein